MDLTVLDLAVKFDIILDAFVPVILVVEFVLLIVELFVENMTVLDTTLEKLSTLCKDGVNVNKAVSRQVGAVAVVFVKHRQPFLELVPDAITFNPFACAVPTGTLWAENKAEFHQ